MRTNGFWVLPLSLLSFSLLTTLSSLFFLNDVLFPLSFSPLFPHFSCSFNCTFWDKLSWFSTFLMLKNCLDRYSGRSCIFLERLQLCEVSSGRKRHVTNPFVFSLGFISTCRNQRHDSATCPVVLILCFWGCLAGCIKVEGRGTDFQGSMSSDKQ
jgi:hypothetical protein